MEKSNAKFLFVVPSASINGALILLMNFYDYLLEFHLEIEIETIVQWGKGEDDDTFFRSKLAKYGKLTFMEELSEENKQKLKKRIMNERIDVIFYNSILSTDTQLFFKEKKCKKIFYVHEMEHLMNVFKINKNISYYDDVNHLFIAGFENVKHALVKVLNIPENKIQILYSFINPEAIKHQTKKAFEIQELNAQPDSKDIFTIGFSGTFELRKSADLLLPLVVEIKKRIRNPKIFWVGASPFIGEPNTFDMVMHDVKVGEFENDIHFIPKRLDYIKYHERFDVYVIMSREDPFPLINLEMGVLGIPIICFEKSGGSPEYAKLGGGVAVPFMDLGAIADKIYEFYSNPQLLAKYKEQTPLIVDNNFSVKVQAPKLLNLIRNFIK